MEDKATTETKNMSTCTLLTLERVINERSTTSAKKSYVAQLLKNGQEEVASKLSEEFAETMEAYDNLMSYKQSSKATNIPQLQKLTSHLTHEVCDLLFHLMVACHQCNLPVAEIATELESRRAISGLQEKKNRKK